MTPDKERKDIERMLDEKRLFDAIDRLRILAPAGSWQIMSELERAEQDYRLMLRYAFNSDGADPERSRLHADITRRLHTVLLTIVRQSLSADSPSLYFSTLRYEKTRPNDSIAALIDDYRKAISGSSLFERSTGIAEGSALSTKEIERCERRIFNRIWTTFPLSAADSAAIGSLWADPAMPERLPLLAVGALLMGALEFPGDETMKLLLDAALSGSTLRLRMRAATAALLLIGATDRSRLSRAVESRIETMAETPGWHRTVMTVWKHFVHSKLTEKIDGKFRDEVLPAMMKLRNSMPDPSVFSDPESMMERNPEWEEMFEKSGLGKKLAELSAMQQEGADLYHSTFSMLKTYPFFNEMPNWFIPFDPDHSEVAAIARGNGSLADMVGMAPGMCDSDKFSLVFSLANIPAWQKNALVDQINAHSDQMAGLAAADLLPEEKKSEAIVNGFMQDLYRFFAHFRRKEEFVNPFRQPLDLSALQGKESPDTDTMRTVAELYFKNGYYSEALDLFARVPADAVTLQKRGFALLQTGRLREALSAFEQSELMDADNAYTLRRIGTLHRRLGHPARALDYFRRLQKLNPDDIAAVISEGHCHLDLGSLHDALHCYYRAEFMDESSIKPVRPIAWVTLLMKDFETSRKYYDRLLRETTPEAADYLNMGHLQLACGNPREALNFYRLFADGKSPEELRTAMEADSPMLAEAGIDTSIIPLIIDALHKR